jgi:glycosyltransferase involved in cell wall biosynthesis
MRVAWIVYGDLAQMTGGYVYDRIVVEGLRSRGEEVALFDPRKHGAVQRIISASFDAVVGDGLCAPHLGRSFERLADGPARVLLVHHLTSWEIEREAGDVMRAIEARAVQASDRLIVTGHATAARLRADHPGRPIAVVIPGADRLGRRPRAPRIGEQVELLFVGSIIPRKRLGLLLDAVERISDPRLLLTVVGDWGRDPEHARAMAARIAASPLLRAQTQAVGSIDDEGLAVRMARADALVLPSSLEGYGIVLVEALHAGLPVIATGASARAAGLGASDVTVFDDGPGLVRAIRRLLEAPLSSASEPRSTGDTPLSRWSETVAAFRRVLRQTMAPAARAPERARRPRPRHRRLPA